VHAPDRPVLSEHALAFGPDHPATFWTLRPGHPLEDRPADTGPNPISGTRGCHVLIIPDGVHDPERWFHDRGADLRIVPRDPREDT
jgi:hypothetical protein